MLQSRRLKQRHRLVAARPNERMDRVARAFSSHRLACDWSGLSGDAEAGRQGDAIAVSSQATAQGVGGFVWSKLLGRLFGEERGYPSLPSTTYAVSVLERGDQSGTKVRDLFGGLGHASSGGYAITL